MPMNQLMQHGREALLGSLIIHVSQTVRQESGQCREKLGLEYLQSMIFLLEVSWHMTTTLNGMVVQRFDAYVGLQVVLDFLGQNRVVFRKIHTSGKMMMTDIRLKKSRFMTQLRMSLQHKHSLTQTSPLSNLVVRIIITLSQWMLIGLLGTRWILLPWILSLSIRFGQMGTQGMQETATSWSQRKS
uniref:Uncharacterized protein n=1 Tax=Opuntia streptacantha TaxID=393608 RepID=A0A7C9EUT5_OPUST